jgi:hypothetical protein
MITFEDGIAVPGFCLKPPYSDELMALCEKLEREAGLRNGAIALYWHLQPIFGMHLKKED